MPVDIDTLNRVQFFSVERLTEDADIGTSWYDTIRCKDLYADEIESNQFFAQEFADDGWLCPNTHNITIFNNPFLFSTGRNFVAVVNDCNTAVDTDEKQGLTPYSSASCATSETIASYIDDVRVEYKILGQNFNPSRFEENGATTPVIKRRFTTDLMSDFTQSMKFSVVENFVRFFNSWFVDLRDFTFFIQGYIDSSAKMNIRTYDFDFLGTSTSLKSTSQTRFTGTSVLIFRRRRSRHCTCG